MDIMELGAMGEMIGGTAVLITPIYLSIQVSGSKQALKTQTHHNLLIMGQRPMELALSEPALAELVNRGNNDPESLSPEEWERYSTYTFMVMNAWGYGYYLDRQGSVQQELWEGGNAYWAGLAMRCPGMQKYWRNNEHAFGEPFRVYARKYFSNVPSDQSVEA